MQIITLTTDWGLKDHYLAVLKGSILSALPGVVIVDVSHNIDPFNLRQASYILKNSFGSFPAGTIHYIGLSGPGNRDSRLTLVSYQGHYFMGIDNGIFSLIFDDDPGMIIDLGNNGGSNDRPEGAFGTVVSAVKHLSLGNPAADLGNPKEGISSQLHFQPVVSGDMVRGLVIYVDNYENVITNITRDVFEKVRGGRKFSIECRGEEITRVSGSYNEVAVGEIAAIFNQAGHLEIAINQGNASGLLGLSVDDPVSIRFG